MRILEAGYGKGTSRVHRGIYVENPSNGAPLGSPNGDGVRAFSPPPATSVIVVLTRSDVIAHRG